MAPLNPYDSPQTIDATPDVDQKNTARHSRSVGGLYCAASAATCAILGAYMVVVAFILRSSRPVVNPWPIELAPLALAILALVLALKGVLRLGQE